MNISKLLVNPPADDKAKVKAFLNSCNLTRHVDTFIEEGFDGMRALFEVTEADLASMGIKRGHRRLLQRAIATARGIPQTTPILIYNNLPVSRNPSSPCLNNSPPKKRKQYVPSRPITPFHEYLSEVRLNLRHNQHLSKSNVNQIARKSWHSLQAVDKEKYERQALHANSDY
ncbi:hypothetical protein K501DRAFT_231263, partial [Backusella circina FSU 941]